MPFPKPTTGSGAASSWRGAPRRFPRCNLLEVGDQQNCSIDPPHMQRAHGGLITYEINNNSIVRYENDRDGWGTCRKIA